MTDIVAHHGLFKDTHLHVDDTGGTGRPVVLIHGWPLSGGARVDQVARTHRAVQGSVLHVIAGGPHGGDVSHADEFNSALLGFLGK